MTTSPRLGRKRPMNPEALSARVRAFKVMASEQSDTVLPTPPSALIGAADVSFCAFLEYILKHIGLVVAADSDVIGLADRLQEQRPDLLLLESQLPGVDIQGLCARLRLNKRTRETAILVLGATGTEPHQDDPLHRT